MNLEEAWSVIAQSANQQIFTSKDIIPHAEWIRKKKKEYLLVFCLDAKHSLIGNGEVVSIGLVNKCLVHPREVFRRAIVKNAVAVVCVHNHPSGSPTLSLEDKQAAQSLYRAGKIIGIKLLDFLSTSTGGYESAIGKMEARENVFDDVIKLIEGESK